ncbi:MAG: GTP cyclohydrolase II [Candidatus Bilamarchaeaceae archaeon]
MTEFYSKAKLPTLYGEFDIYIFKDSGKEHTVLLKDNYDHPVLVRVHSQCLTGDIFSSLKCDCGEQLVLSLAAISQVGGLLIYLAQEGRGIGLGNKIRAYSLQENGLDTINANIALGFRADERDYSTAADILKYFNINHIALLTNNPKKITALQNKGFKVERIPIITARNPYNQIYLETKEKKMNHLLCEKLTTKEEIIKKYQELVRKNKIKKKTEVAKPLNYELVK